MADTDDIPTLSTGDPSTLGSYKQLVDALFGPDSAPARFINEEIAKDPDGEDGIVIAHESQMLYLFGQLYRKELDEQG